MPTNPQQAPGDSNRDPPAAHWPNPAGEYSAGTEARREQTTADEDAARLERTDPKSLRSAAPGDGTGVTGTVPPA